MVVLRVVTDPPGAEVRQGDRVFGLAPRDVQLPRSSVPVRLTFQLDGYEPGSTVIVPLDDDTVRVQLTARPKPKRRRAPPARPAKPPAQTDHGETLPNPY
jgi:hypothetical protein